MRVPRLKRECYGVVLVSDLGKASLTVFSGESVQTVWQLRLASIVSSDRAHPLSRCLHASLRASCALSNFMQLVYRSIRRTSRPARSAAEGAFVRTASLQHFERYPTARAMQPKRAVCTPCEWTASLRSVYFCRGSAIFKCRRC